MRSWRGVWRTPEALVTIGFERSRVVMTKEARRGLTRCVRTREISQRILPTAHAAGARGLAMEALLPRRSVVERRFSWVARFGQWARDYERPPAVLAGLRFITFACLLLHSVTEA
jgi:transposase